MVRVHSAMRDSSHIMRESLSRSCTWQSLLVKQPKGRLRLASRLATYTPFNHAPIHSYVTTGQYLELRVGGWGAISLHVDQPGGW